MKQKKKLSVGMNVGSSSILVTFVLLCLVTFAALSFVSAKSDNNLTIQTADRIKAYYAADTMAEINLANIDSLLSLLASETDETEYFQNIENQFKDNELYNITSSDEGTFIHYIIPVNDVQSLSVTLKAIYPASSNDDTFEIVEWENILTYVPEDETLAEEKGGFLF